MANINVKLNTPTPWTSEGASDTATCTLTERSSKEGIQIDAPGLSFQDLTVSVTTVGGAVIEPAIPTDATESIVVGIGFSIASITVSGAAAGDYNISFWQ